MDDGNTGTNAPIQLLIAASGSIDRALSAALRPSLRQMSISHDRAISVLIGPGFGEDEIAAICREAGSEVEGAGHRLENVVRITNRIRTGLGGGGWGEVPLGEAARFTAARLPIPYLRHDWILCLRLPTSNMRSTGTSPIAALAALAHPRQRVAAKLARSDPGAMAELGTAAPPLLVLLSGRLAGERAAAATSNLVAAELLWLAWRSLEAGDEGPVPWQDPLVQRASALLSAPKEPDEVEIAIVTDSSSSSRQTRLVEAADRLAAAIGVSRRTAVVPHRQ